MQPQDPSNNEQQVARTRQSSCESSLRCPAAPEPCIGELSASPAIEYISYERGLAAYLDKRYRDARNLLAHACKLQPKNVAFRVTFLLAEGMRLLQESEIEAALQAFATGYKLDPSNTECLVELLKCRQLILRKKTTLAWWSRIFRRE